MKAMNIMIKPASSLCNMRCDYCFYNDVAANRDTACYGMMSEQTLEKIIQESFGFVDENCNFAFQGGEPTLCGLAFYERLMEFEQQYNTKDCKVTNCIQTNGYTIDEQWAKFFKKHNFLVGISLDGDAHIHNLNRNDANQKGTFNRIMKSIALLEKYGVEYNILSVITQYSARAVDRLFTFYQKHGFRFVQFIPCIDPLRNERGQSKHAMSTLRYGEFLCRAFDCWYEGILQNRYISIRFFDNVWNMLQGMQPEICSMYGRCVPQLVIEADGGVYPCDFYVLDEWRLGNIMQDEFDSLLNSPKWEAFITRSVDIPSKCKQCRYFPLCRNGCYRDRIQQDGGMQNYYCEAYQVFFEHALPKLQRMSATRRR